MSNETQLPVLFYLPIALVRSLLSALLFIQPHLTFCQTILAITREKTNDTFASVFVELL